MVDRIPDTPIRKSTVTKDSMPLFSDSSEDETIATVPLYPHLQATATQPSTVPTQPLYTQKMTQPTQIIERPTPPRSSPTRNSSVVQVATSSPLAPPTSSRFQGTRPGVLSTSMAPSGTRFRPPGMAVPVKRTPVIDLDDDGPTYRGGSSDDDSPPGATDIKPSTFIKASKSPEKERVAESPVAANSASIFKEITAAAFYNPNSAMKSFGKRQVDATSAQGPSAKRPRSNVTSPGRDTLTLADIEDYNLRTKVERMRNVFSNKTVQACMDALLKHKGNYEDAMDYLATIEDPAPRNLHSSEDELSLDNKSTAAPAPVAPAKQQIKARTRIQDKWAAGQRMGTKSNNDAAAAPPRRRLIRGPKSHQVSPVSSPVRLVEPEVTKKPGRLVKGRKNRSRSRSESPILTHIEDSTDSAPEEVEDDGSLQEKVLNFFNTCSADDLADIAEVAPNVASLIMSKRPFKSLAQVREISVETSQPTKGARGRKTKKAIGDKVVDKCLDMWTGYEAVDALVKQCETLGKPIADEMKKWGVDIFGAKTAGELELVSLDKPSSSHDSGFGTPSSDGGELLGRKLVGQPSIMSENIKMKDYQIVGINWLSLLFGQNLSCILADDMGLGKTCQVIAFLAHLFEKGVHGPHLIVVPSSTLENWLREFSVFCPKLNVMPYYAGQTERAHIRQEIEDNRDSINVVVTTYTIAKAKVDSAFLASMNFCACVFDEGHMLKSSKSLLYAKLIRIPARFRLLLTGTPLQNNLQELASLLGFILPQVFKERKDDLEFIFSAKAKTVDTHSALLSAQRIARAKSMLTPFVLRRKKHQVIDLPAKITRVEYCTMNDAQKEIYHNETEKVRQIIADRAAGKKVVSKSTNILMKLRQAAIHPLFYRRQYDDKTLSRIAKACVKDPKWAMSDPDAIYEELLPYNDFECHTLCATNPDSLGKFALKNNEWMDSGKVEKLCELLKKYTENGDRILVFSQFTMVMDILEEVLETLHIRFFRLDGTTSVEDRQSILDAFYEQVDIPVFMLSTKAGGAGINLACANKVIIFDSSFNPQDDIQAENRAHRVGQTREVEVVRLVTKGTIEEQIYALGQTKLMLDQRVAGEEDGGKKSEEAGMKAVEEMVMAKLEGEQDGDGNVDGDVNVEAQGSEGSGGAQTAEKV